MNGSKTIDLRNYELPSDLVETDIGVVEKDKGGVPWLVGIVRFSRCIKYTDAWQWKSDYRRHLVRKRYGLHCETTLMYDHHVSVNTPIFIHISTQYEPFINIRRRCPRPLRPFRLGRKPMGGS